MNSTLKKTPDYSAKNCAELSTSHKSPTTTQENGDDLSFSLDTIFKRCRDPKSSHSSAKADGEASYRQTMTKATSTAQPSSSTLLGSQETQRRIYALLDDVPDLTSLSEHGHADAGSDSTSTPLARNRQRADYLSETVHSTRSNSPAGIRVAQPPSPELRSICSSVHSSSVDGSKNQTEPSQGNSINTLTGDHDRAKSITGSPTNTTDLGSSPVASHQHVNGEDVLAGEKPVDVSQGSSATQQVHERATNGNLSISSPEDCASGSKGVHFSNSKLTGPISSSSNVTSV